jgi:hypothetical protein
VKFLLVLAAVGAAAWFYLKPQPPGKGPAFEAARRPTSMLLLGLERYRTFHGGYPYRLEDMVPDVLSKLPKPETGSSFEYRFLPTGQYKLTIRYFNPLPVHCWYEGTKKWHCEWF